MKATIKNTNNIHLQQQKAIVHLSHLSLTTSDLLRFLKEACQLVTKNLNLEYCLYFRLLDNKNKFLLISGDGIDPKFFNQATIGTENKSHAGYTFLAKKPVIFKDLRSEKRFSPSPVLKNLKAVSGLSVIAQINHRPFGVIEALSTKERKFTRDDIYFLQSVANIIATAIRHTGYHEELLKKNSAVQQTADAVFMTDTAGIIQYVNPAFEKLTGYSSKEALGKTPRIIKSDKADPDNAKKLWETILHGKVYRAVVTNKRKNGREFIVDHTITPIRDNRGKVTYFVGSWKDISDQIKIGEEKIKRVKVEEKLKAEAINSKKQAVLLNKIKKINLSLSLEKRKTEKERDIWEAVFENVEEGVYTMGPDLRITQANISLLTMCGMTRKAIVGKKYYEVLHCHDHKGNYFPDFDAGVKILSRGQGISYDEHLHSDKNGKEHWVGVSLAPIYNSNGDVDQIVSVNRDITTNKEIEKSKSEFVSIASHELRTPLTVINGYLSMLLNGDLGDLKDPQTQEQFITLLGKVYGETRRLTVMSEELLNVSRIESGRVKLLPEKILLTNLIKEAVDDLKQVALEKNIALIYSHSCPSSVDSCFVYADRNKIKQVIVNLVDNAIKYNRQDGEVQVLSSVKDNQVITQIIDNGHGIDRKVLPRIFEKFQRGTGNYVKENSGTGLGLFIVKSLLEMQHGRIWVESKAGKGTKFIFSLPLLH